MRWSPSQRENLDGESRNGAGGIKDHSGKTLWRYRAPRSGAPNPTQVEHDRLVAAIKNNTLLNNACYGADSFFTAVLGRLTTCTGQQVDWNTAVESEFSLLSDELDWDQPAPVQPQADGSTNRPNKSNFST